MWRIRLLDVVPWTLLLLASSRSWSRHASSAAGQILSPLSGSLSTKETQGLYSVVQSPENTAVVAGERISFVCISNTSFLNWFKANAADTPHTSLVSSCMLNQAVAGIYDLENVGVGRCDLVVLGAGREQAGTYLCMETIGFDRFLTAQLAVLDAEPDCSIDKVDPRYGDNVTLTCDVTYTDNISPMLMTWTDEQGRTVPSNRSKTSRAGRTTSSYTFTVTSYGTLSQYTCTTKFSPPVGLPSTATNTPAYTHSWTSPALVVNVKKTPQNTAGVVGDSIRLACHMTTQEIIWNFVPINQTLAIAIAVGCKVAPNVEQKYRVESGDGACHLVIDKLSSAHAGTYICQDFLSPLTPASAELIVLASQPINSMEEELGGREQQMTCSIDYAGNFAPVVTWTDETGAVFLSTSVTTRTRVVSRALVTPGASQVVTSTTHFDKPSVDPPGHVDPATNAPDYTHRWNRTLMEPLGDCSEIMKNNPDAKSGIYTILIHWLGRTIEIEVYCDMDTAGGGWTVFQRRQDNSVNFYTSWMTYAKGFGNLDGEFWLGNDNLAALTDQKQYVLRVDLENWSNIRRWAQYTSFRVLGDVQTYNLSSLGAYSGDAGDSLSYHLGMAFTTHDQDNDLSSQNCAIRVSGAWWYNDCFQSNLNGLHYSNSQGVVWYHFDQRLKFTEMKIRPVNF